MIGSLYKNIHRTVPGFTTVSGCKMSKQICYTSPRIPFSIIYIYINRAYARKVLNCRLIDFASKMETNFNLTTFQAENWDWHTHRYSFFPQLTSEIISIMTHCYDDSGLRLFAAGGPLPLDLIGNYASIWE